MPIIHTTCSECSGQLEISFGSRCFKGQLTWSASYYCKDCDYAVEEDAWDMIPEDYRELELQHDGVWSILFLHSSYSKITALKIIRQCLDLSMPEITCIKKQLPGPVLTGTQAEMDRIAYYLSESDIVVEVVLAK